MNSTVFKPNPFLFYDIQKCAVREERGKSITVAVHTASNHLLTNPASTLPLTASPSTTFLSTEPVIIRRICPDGGVWISREAGSFVLCTFPSEVEGWPMETRWLIERVKDVESHECLDWDLIFEMV
jgi:hypothetical protein